MTGSAGTPPVYGNLIDGHWTPARSGATFDDVNPADTGDVVGRLP